MTSAGAAHPTSRSSPGTEAPGATRRTSRLSGSQRRRSTPRPDRNDLLISYDFGGSGTPDITLFTWDGSAWGNQKDLTALGFAEAKVNTASRSERPPDLL